MQWCVQTKALVGNHLMRCWVDEDACIVTVARVRYARSEYQKRLD